MKFLLVFSILLLVVSCDFSTHEYVSYNTRNDSDDGISLGWDTEGNCSISFYDTALVFDEVEIEFPSNRSRFKSELIRSRYYTYDDAGVNIIDSTEYWNYEFDLEENDPLIPLNDSMLVFVFLNKKKIKVDTLYRENTSSDFVDRLPLPKLH